MSKQEICRECRIAGTILFLDGLSGAGKAMMGPILSSLDRVEVQRMDHIHEFVCTVRFLGRIEEDAAVALLRMYADLAAYNVMIGRESNFRWKDLSGVLRNPGGWRYLIRLFLQDGDPVLERIRRVRPILQIHSHELLGISQPLFLAFGKRLRVVEMVRHPLYLLETWCAWIDRFGRERDLAICLGYEGGELPWFAYGWEEKYLSSSRMDRVIYLIGWFTRLSEDTLRKLDETTRRQVLVIPFERFVVDPWPYLHEIEELLGTTTTVATRRALRKQRVPRRLSTDGRDLPIYRRYNWQPPAKNSSESTELKKRWDYAVCEATKGAMEMLESLCKEYEERYWAQGFVEGRSSHR